MEKGPVFGLNICDLLEVYDHDSQSWKMSGCLFTGDYAKSLEALPKSGIMQNGKIYEQRTWVRRTKGKEFGLWPYPEKQFKGRLPERKTKKKSGPAFGCEDLPNTNSTRPPGNGRTNATVKDSNGTGNGISQQYCESNGEISDTNRPRLQAQGTEQQTTGITGKSTQAGQWPAEPSICRMDDGLSSELYGYQGRLITKSYKRVDKLKGLGSAIVSQIAEILFRQIMEVNR